MIGMNLDSSPLILEYDADLALANLNNWNDFLNITTESQAEPFDWSHQRLLAGSGSRKTELHNPYTVSGFANWIFSIYRRDRSPFALAVGKEAERRITQIRLQHSNNHHDWDLLPDGTGEARHALPATELALNGQILHGSPDLVFRERRTGRIVIVEIKASDAVLPRDGWPNLRAQLWAYSRLNEWRDSPGMLLVGEVWNERGTRCRGTYGWNAMDGVLNNQNKELFIEYRKVVEHRMLRL
jgi:hypothetical protein